jgi:hypothetical protein
MRMDSKRLEDLMARYWECETSLEEEQELHQYFATEPVPEQWKEAATLFRYFEKQRKLGVAANFDESVVSRIKAPRGKMTSLVQISLRIAAGVAVVLAAVFFVRQEIRKNDNELVFEDTYDDPQKALEETKKALMMISKGFGRAEAQAKKINLLNEAQDKVKSKETEDSTKL